MSPEHYVERLAPFILISEVDDGRAFAEHIFQRKFRE